MRERLTDKNEKEKDFRHDEEPKAPGVAIPLDVQPFLRRSVEAETAITKLKRDSDGDYRRKAPEECAFTHARNLARLTSAFHP